MSILLDISQLHVRFKSSRGVIHAVRGLDLTIHKGEIIGLIGESGCGKSTIAHAILQLLPHSSEISAKHLLFENTSLLNQSQRELEGIRGKKISMIFQDPTTSLNPTMTIGRQIMEILFTHQKISKQEAYLKAQELLAKVGIGEAQYRMNQYPHEFSGGMKQRVLIAIALACQPSLIIADEPTTALDPTTQIQILELLKTIREEEGTTFLFITHDLGVAAYLCDRVFVMYAGQLVETAPVDQLFSSPKHPYTQALLKSKKSLTTHSHELFAIPGSPPNLMNSPPQCSFAPRCPYAMKICQQSAPVLETHNSLHQTACWLNAKKTQHSG